MGRPHEDSLQWKLTHGNRANIIVNLRNPSVADKTPPLQPSRYDLIDLVRLRIEEVGDAPLAHERRRFRDKDRVGSVSGQAWDAHVLRCALEVD